MKWIKRAIILLIVLFFVFRIVVQLEPQKHTQYTKINTKNTCIALNYHRIRKANLWLDFLKFTTNSNELTKYTVFEHEFTKQMKWLKAHDATFVSQKQLLTYYQSKRFPKRCVWISFDDADQTTYDVAYPILKKYQIPATVFVIAGHVGENFSNIPLMSWQDLNEMKSSQIIDFGSHTYNLHEFKLDQPILNQVSPNALKQDIQKSEYVLNRKLNTTINTFAYPYGNANEHLKKGLKQSGIKYAFIISTKPISIHDDPYFLNRIMVDRDVFKLRIEPLESFKK